MTGGTAMGGGHLHSLGHRLHSSQHLQQPLHTCWLSEYVSRGRVKMWARLGQHQTQTSTSYPGLRQPWKTQAPSLRETKLQTQAPPFLHGKLKRSCLPAPYPSSPSIKMNHFTRSLWNQTRCLLSTRAWSGAWECFLGPHRWLSVVGTPSKCYNSPMKQAGYYEHGWQRRSQKLQEVQQIDRRSTVCGNRS